MRDDSGAAGAAARRFSRAVILALAAALVAGFAVGQSRLPDHRLAAAGPPAGTTAAEALPGVRLPASHPELVRRALTDLRSLTTPDGAALASWPGPWRYVWPRDASFVAAAYCATGAYGEAQRVLGFLNRVHPDRGRFAARYHPDGSGPVADQRRAQLDGSGWVLWAVGFCADRQGAPAADAGLTAAWPMVRQAADQIAAELGPDGLPAPSPDYWERAESRVTLGTVGPLLAGLPAAARVADRLGHGDDANRWRTAEQRLRQAVEKEFGARGYPRTRGGGPDSIVAVLGPPFAVARPETSAAIARTHELLTLPNGGITPGADWRADGVAWTPSTALFGLSAAARGDHATADAVLGWLADHRTADGALPEKVLPSGAPSGPAPLAWTAALVVLTADALDRTPPAPGG